MPRQPAALPLRTITLSSSAWRWKLELDDVRAATAPPTLGAVDIRVGVVMRCQARRSSGTRPSRRLLAPTPPPQRLRLPTPVGPAAELSGPAFVTNRSMIYAHGHCGRVCYCVNPTKKPSDQRSRQKRAICRQTTTFHAVKQASIRLRNLKYRCCVTVIFGGLIMDCSLAREQACPKAQKGCDSYP